MIGQNDELLLVNARQLAMGALGDKANAVVAMRVEVVAAIVIPEGPDNNVVGGVVKFDRRPKAGLDTNRTDGELGVVPKTASANQQGIPLVWLPKTSLILNPGEEVVVEVTTANGAALMFAAFLVVRHSPESWLNLAKASPAKAVLVPVA